MNSQKTKSGVSMLISIGIVSVIVLFSLIVSNVVITSIRQSANVNRANEAYFAAEGGLEQGLLANLDEGAGYTSGDVAASGLDATYTIQGQVPLDMKYVTPSPFAGKYGTPTPGTGDAGSDCDPLKAVIGGTGYNGFYYDNVHYSNEEPANHPCNWNKMYVGDIVAIPLYIYDKTNCSASNNYICNPANLNLDELFVRIRTACGDGTEMCSFTSRFQLDDTVGDPDLVCDSGNNNQGCGDTIISWTISGDSFDGTATYELRPKLDNLKPFFKRPFLNSEIYEYLINGAMNGTLGPYGVLCAHKYCNLSHAHLGNDILNDEGPDTVLNFLKNLSQFARPGIGKSIHKPVLRLSLIHSLKEKGTSYTVPYLEYQVISSIAGSSGPTDTSQTIKSEGFSGEFKQILEVKQPQEGGFIDYVIQQ